MRTLGPADLVGYLRHRGWIGISSDAEVIPLNGGVSSAIHLVTTDGRRFVVKQALEKLRVNADWRCDPARNLSEQEFLRLAHAWFPGSVPELFHCDRERGLFLMEYLDGLWSTWKSRLWAGEFTRRVAARTGERLGTLHRNGWAREDLARRFGNAALFHELRIAPYLLTTASRHPELAPLFEREAQRLSGCGLTLVHGDYSPKNLLTDGEEVKILDAEVACFGDPAFDVAFLLNHLLLKAVRFPKHAADFLDLAAAFLDAYRAALGDAWSGDLDERAARLVLMLMMARISGKSPVEYLDSDGPEARFVLGFASGGLSASGGALRLADLFVQFSESLAYENHSR